MENPDKRLDLLTRLGHGKGHKNKTNRKQKWGQWEKEKWKSILILDVMI